MGVQGVQFGTWPPAGKTPTDAANMRLLGSVKIGSAGTVGNDALGVVASVTHDVTGEYVVVLKLGTLTNNANVAAVLANSSGQIDASIGGSAATVHTRDSAGTLADRDFNLLILG